MVCGGESKVRWCKEQYCTGTWNAGSTNQGKLEVVKQEMARVNIDVLGTSELKWPGKGKFNSDDHYIHHLGQESLRRNGVSLIVNKRAQNAVLGCNLKNDRMNSGRFHGKPLDITVTQVYVPTTNAEEAEVELFYEDLQDLLELTAKKDVLFIIEDWNAKKLDRHYQIALQGMIFKFFFYFLLLPFFILSSIGTTGFNPLYHQERLALCALPRALSAFKNN